MFLRERTEDQSEELNQQMTGVNQCQMWRHSKCDARHWQNC